MGKVKEKAVSIEEQGDVDFAYFACSDGLVPVLCESVTPRVCDDDSKETHIVVPTLFSGASAVQAILDRYKPGASDLGRMKLVFRPSHTVGLPAYELQNPRIVEPFSFEAFPIEDAFMSDGSHQIGAYASSVVFRGLLTIVPNAPGILDDGGPMDFATREAA